MTQPILELRNITKAFGPKVANDDISLTILPGVVHAIVGENGAGKTTLMTMIAGTAQADSGEILFEGKPVTISDPKKADELGIGMVHQHFKLVPSLTVAANVFLGKEILTKRGSLDTHAMERRVAELSQQFGLEIDPQEVVEDLSVGERQRVEIIKALSHDTRVLILDEPTAVLTPAETDDLFVVIRRLVADGCAVVFISHKLGEVLAIADEVTVIRDGKVVGSRPAAGLSQPEIASMMVGREVLLRIKHTEANPTDEVLSVQNVYAVDSRGAIAVNNLSLSVRRGEIVGIAGVEGNGQSELAAAIAGMHHPERGSVHLLGKDITTSSVASRRKAGLAYIPEDRHEVGAAPALTVAENMAATHLKPPLTQSGWLKLGAIRTFAADLISKFDIRGANAGTTISTLSGGNMQKVIIAREFSAQPSLLMVSQPTRGVDVGAMEFVHNSIVAARDAGAAVLLFSADLNEVMSLSDRLLVMYRGEIIAEFTQETMSEIAVGLAMAGVKPTAEKLAEAEAEHAEIKQRLAQAAVTDVPLETIEASEEATTDSEDLVDIHDDVASLFEDPTAAVAEPEQIEGLQELRGGEKPWWRRVLDGAGAPLLAIALALVIGAAIILATGNSPIEAYSALFTSAWKTDYGIASIVAFFIPLSLMSAAVIVSFRAGFFNIGGEGQLFMGAFWGAWAGFTFTQLPGPVIMILVLVVGAAAGAIWGFIPGALLAYWKVDIIVTTLLMSTLASLFTLFLVTGPFQDPSSGFPATVPIASSARFTMFNSRLGIGPDLVIALALAIFLGFVLNRSTWGLGVRELGEMNRFAEYTGVSPKAMSIQVMMLSGAASGLAGALFVLGPNGGRFSQMFSPGYGFLAITVALLARLNPWASLVAALFYATMMAGGTGLQATGVPFPLVNVLQGLIIIFITAQFVISWRRKSKSRFAPDTPAEVEPATKEA